MELTKTQKLTGLLKQKEDIEFLKNTLFVSKPNSNAGDLIALKSVPALLHNKKLKNKKRISFGDGIKYIEDQFEKMIDSYIEVLTDNINEL